MYFNFEIKFNFTSLILLEKSFFHEKSYLSEKLYLELLIKVAFCCNTITHYTNKLSRRPSTTLTCVSKSTLVWTFLLQLVIPFLPGINTKPTLEFTNT